VRATRSAVGEEFVIMADQIRVAGGEINHAAVARYART
jgi:hypothetical protein